MMMIFQRKIKLRKSIKEDNPLFNISKELNNLDFNKLKRHKKNKLSMYKEYFHNKKSQFKEIQNKQKDKIVILKSKYKKLRKNNILIRQIVSENIGQKRIFIYNITVQS